MMPIFCGTIVSTRIASIVIVGTEPPVTLLLNNCRNIESCGLVKGDHIKFGNDSNLSGVYEVLDSNSIIKVEIKTQDTDRGPSDQNYLSMLNHYGKNKRFKK